MRAFAVGLLAAPAAWLLRNRGPELRHALWAAVLAAMLLLPVLTPLLPPVYLSAGIAAPEIPSPAIILPPRASQLPSHPLPAPRPSRTVAWPVLLLAAYLMVAAILLLRVAVSVRRTGRILAAARPLRDEALLQAMADLSLAAGRGFPLPPLCESDAVPVPFAAGWREPAIVLPANWREWDPFRQRAVLAHELAHLRRLDWPLSVMAAMNRAVFFFHPLAWFIERRLAALAEESCDASALAVSGDPRCYAAVLFDFAAQLPNRAVPATAMARSSKVGVRIERLISANLTVPRPLGKLTWCALAALALPVLYAAASLQPGQQPLPPVTIERQAESPFPRNSIPGANTTPQQAAELEQRLAQNPHDLDARARLIGYYFSNGYIPRWLDHLTWAIDNHPEASLHETYSSRVAADRAMVQDAGVWQRLQDLWRRKAIENPSNVDVLLHAAEFFRTIDRLESRRLFEAARVAAPEDRRALGALVGIWMIDLRLFTRDFPEQDRRAEEALDEFLRGKDADLIGNVGMLVQPKNLDFLVDTNPRAHGGNEEFQRWRVEMQRRQLNASELLLARAAQLDPSNPKWPEALQKLRSLTQPAAAPVPPETPKRINVGAGVQERMLIESPPPKYPPLARQARIQGDVKFSIVINPEGDVTFVTLVSGHPLLVQAAVDAVKQYRYRPTLLNGQPVEVATQVTVPFRLPD